MSDTLPGAGHKCRVCSMPFAADLIACPSCAYDRRAAAEAEARRTAPPATGEPVEVPPGRAGGIRRWKARHQRG